MLLQLKLKNFRQHEDKTFDFTEGLNVIRGMNEAGKTTVLEAIGYGAFGADACRDPLDQVVTWGKSQKELAVEQLWLLNGVRYHLKRSKAGAEITYGTYDDETPPRFARPGGRVVGQSDVTRFMQTLFGCDAKVAGKLMLASQGAIRGALAEGPTKTAELIETLADFNQIDRIVEALQANYVTGPVTLAEERLAKAEADLALAKAAVMPVDVSLLEARVAALGQDIRANQQQIDTELKPAYETAKSLMHGAEHAKTTRDSLNLQLLRAQGLAAGHQQQRLAALAAAGDEQSYRNLQDAVIGQRASIVGAENIERELAVYRQFAALKFPDTYWEGDEESLQAEVTRVSNLQDTAAKHASAIRQDIRTAEAEIRVQEAKRVAASACGYCGKDMRDVPEVAAKNREIDQAIARCRQDIARWTTAAKGNQETHDLAVDALASFDAVYKAARPFMDFIARHGDRVIVTLGTYPPRLAWDGAVPKAGVDVTALRKQLADLEARLKASERAQAQAEQLEKTLNEDLTTISKLQADIAALAVADELPARQAAFEIAATRYNDAMVANVNAATEKQKLAFEISAAHEAARRSRDLVKMAEAAVASARAELEQQHFSNALLKRIRAARPMIADKLWSMVLSAVSTYFSRMRGKDSIVAREGKSFVVDGKKSALSGSTLDILGLAIRVALTRTFLPNAPFLILDEPAAAMDDERTAATMAFLVASGFPQTLLVTHEEMSESVADNLITI
jgi:DNA repair exonuclease SbcCD ATPase subunit